MTVSYEITIQLDDPSLAEALEKYMRDEHVRDVFATGCFLDARLETSGPDLYRSRYTVVSRDELRRYAGEFAPALRADFLRRFPAGVTLTRAVWDEQIKL